MLVLKYKKKQHLQIVRTVVQALRQGKVVVYPTDTSYGLAVDATNSRAIKKLYEVKGRDFKKAVSVVLPSLHFGKKFLDFSSLAIRFSKSFFPGKVSLVLPFKKNLKKDFRIFRKLASKGGELSVRMPKHPVSEALVKSLKSPITATSANVSGMPDCYSCAEIEEQYMDREKKPDLVLDFGVLKKNKPSTVVKIVGEKLEILRQGPVSEKSIEKFLKKNKK